jgi:exopolysaccharide biosynthesis polyprenyl glycosylphosphotransferase
MSPYHPRWGALYSVMGTAGRRDQATGCRQFDLPARWLVVPDAVAVATAWAVSLALVGPGRGETSVPAALELSVVAAASAVGVIASQGMYRSWTYTTGSIELARLLRSVPIAALAVLGVARFIDVPVSATRAIVGGTWMLGALVLGRWVMGAWARNSRRSGRLIHHWLLVGANVDARELWQHIASRPDCGYVIDGYVGDRAAGDRLSWCLPWLGETCEAVTVARARALQGLVIVHAAVSSEELNVLVRTAHLHRLDVELSGGLSHLHHRRLLAIDVAHEPVLFVEPPRSGSLRTAAKRLFDVVGSAMALIALSPLLLAISATILLRDGRPVLYSQIRTGKGGREFRMLKFRTMARGADDQAGGLRSLNERTSGPLFKINDDPRVTRVGRALRALSLDELPQLLNVLGGSMSLVGPRPALPSEVADFDEELLKRNGVKPGMTGLWQIEARDNPVFHAYRQLDLFYAENWSLSLDVAILLATAPGLLRHAKFELRRRQEAAARQAATAPLDLPAAVPISEPSLSRIEAL